MSTTKTSLGRWVYGALIAGTFAAAQPAFAQEFVARIGARVGGYSHRRTRAR